MKRLISSILLTTTLLVQYAKPVKASDDCVLVFGSSDTHCIDNSRPSPDVPYVDIDGFVAGKKAEMLHNFLLKSTFEPELKLFAINYNMIVYKSYMGIPLNHEEHVYMMTVRQAYNTTSWQYRRKGVMPSEKTVLFLEVVDIIVNFYFQDNTNWRTK